MQVTVRGLRWRPLRRRRPVLDGLDLEIPAGQRVLLAGPSGAGKSTLLRALAGLLLTADHGEMDGEVLLDGRSVEEVPARPALLLQDPLAARVAETVGRDVAFALENAGVSRAELWPRVRRALKDAAFPYPEHHPTVALSGGESQRLALAASLASGARLMLLDEPTSMLDQRAAKGVRRSVRRQVAEQGTTLVIVEHRLEPWLEHVDRLIVMGADGQLVADGEPAAVVDQWRDVLVHHGVWVPGSAPPAPLDVPPDLVGPWTDGPAEVVSAHGVGLVRRSGPMRSGAPPVHALRDVDAEMRAGEVLGVTGPSGAGKSSLVSVLSGLVAPTTGSVVSAPELATRRGRAPYRWRSRDLAARLAWVPQSPEHGVVTGSVRDELSLASAATGRAGARASRRADGIAEVLGLGQVATASPYHLSGGEQRRLMLGSALVHGPNALLADEPTVGQDSATWAAIVGLLAAARAAGTAVALATHDDLALDVLADETLSLASGAGVR